MNSIGIATGVLWLTGRKAYIPVLIFLIILSSTVRSQSFPPLHELLRNTYVDHLSFRQFAKQYGWVIVDSGALEGGVIGEDNYLINGSKALKRYGYYAMRSVKGVGMWSAVYREKNKRRRQKDLSAFIASRDTMWNDFDESVWNEIRLIEVPDTVAQVYLRQVSDLGGEEIYSCITWVRVGGIQKRYFIDKRYSVIFDRYPSGDTFTYEITISIPKCLPEPTNPQQ